MNEIIIKDDIENMIYEIRGKQVMLDSDLARLYECKGGTKEINQAVTRNINKFPPSFSWKLEDYEMDILRSQFVTTNHLSSMSRSNPRVFTEQGLTMLATILKSQKAIETSIKIVNTFSLLLDLLSIAKKEIIIIDNYASKELFDILKNIKVNIKIITKNIDGFLIKKYKKQYNNIEIIYSDKFHDRFIIIDKNTLYHSGASFKDLGNKCFSINEIKNKEFIERILIKIEGD